MVSIDNQQGSRYSGGILTQKQKDIVVGLLLGDGCLEHDHFLASRLQIKQAAKKKDYVFWLYHQLESFVKTPPKQRPDTQQWYFSTRSLRELEEFRHIFYKNGRKIIPDDIGNYLISPITLAVWYMDDGSLDYREKSHYSFTLSTDSFTVEEVNRLKLVLIDKFLIESSIQTPSSRGTKYTKLYIGKAGRNTFLKIISPYIIFSSFAYKMPQILDPSETDL